MPRSNFTTLIPSTVQGFNLAGAATSPLYIVPDARFASETSSGVSRRKPTGWIPPTGYSMTHKVYALAQGETKYYYKANPNLNNGIVRGCVGGANGRFNSLNHFNELCGEGIIDGSLANLALIAARSKLKASSVNLAVAYGERRQTANLIGDTATRLANTVNDLRRGKVRNAMRSLGLSAKHKQPRGSTWPNQWLELQYGWKPLLSDIYGACDALSKRPKSDWRVTATASRKSKFTNSKDWPGLGTGSVQVEQGAFVRIDALPSNEAAISLASLGVSNPALLAWELVPYSFVVDWFIPVGGWLESLDALLGYSSAYTSSTSFAQAKWYESGSSYEISGFVYQNSYVGNKRMTVVSRSASAGVPLPTFPRIKDPRSLGHMANGLALLAQAFRR